MGASVTHSSGRRSGVDTRGSLTPPLPCRRACALSNGLDQGRSGEGEREGHIDVALAAVLAGSDVPHIGDSARLHLSEPRPRARDGADELGAGLGTERTNLGTVAAVRDEQLAVRLAGHLVHGIERRTDRRQVGHRYLAIRGPGRRARHALAAQPSCAVGPARTSGLDGL